MSSEALSAAVRRALEAVAIPEDAGPMQAYMKSAMPYLGVKKPARVAALKPIFAALPVDGPDALAENVEALWSQAIFREERYAALDLLDAARHRKHHQLSLLPLLERIITEGAWWDHVDACARPNRNLLERAPEPMRARLRSWARGSDLWLRRSAMIAQLRRKTELDFELLCELIQTALESPGLHNPLPPKTERFFLHKAAGWALRDHAHTAPEAVRAYLAQNQDLPRLTRREASKHL